MDHDGFQKSHLFNFFLKIPYIGKSLFKNTQREVSAQPPRVAIWYFTVLAFKTSFIYLIYDYFTCY